MNAMAWSNRSISRGHTLARKQEVIEEFERRRNIQ